VPVFDFACEGGHREADVLIRGGADLDAPRKCPTCAAPSKRLFGSFTITGATEAIKHYDFEKDAWALATGERHDSPRDLREWCEARGKTIVDKGYKPKAPEPFEDHELDKALDKVYHENHDIGEIG